MRCDPGFSWEETSKKCIPDEKCVQSKEQQPPCPPRRQFSDYKKYFKFYYCEKLTNTTAMVSIHQCSPGNYYSLKHGSCYPDPGREEYTSVSINKNLNFLKKSFKKINRKLYNFRN